MAKVPAIEPWTPGEEVKAEKMSSQVNQLNDFFLKGEHILVQQIDKSYRLTANDGNIYLNIIGEPDQYGGWNKPSGEANSNYVAPDDGLYFFHAQFSPCTPDFSSSSSDLPHTIQIRAQYKKADASWDKTYIANAYSTNQWMNKSWNVAFTAETCFTLWMNKGDAVRFPVYLGEPMGGVWAQGYRPEWEAGAPSSNRVLVWRLSPGASSFSSPSPEPLPTQEPWSNGEVVTAAKLNSQTADLHKHLSSLPRFYVSGHDRPSSNVSGMHDVPWRTSKAQQCGDWKFNGKTVTVPTSGLYFIAADICVENQSGKVLQYLTAHLLIDGDVRVILDEAAQRSDQVNVTFNIYSLQYLTAGQKVGFATAGQSTYNWGSSPTVNGYTYNKGSWSMHMLAGGMSDFGEEM